MSYCLNCGHECHEGKVLKRTETMYESEGSMEYEIENQMVNPTHFQCVKCYNLHLANLDMNAK